MIRDMNPKLSGGGQPNMNVNVDLSMATTIACDGCGGKVFRQAVVLKRIPKLQVGTPTDVPVGVPIFRCDDCGEVLKEFIPKSAGDFDSLFGNGDADA